MNAADPLYMARALELARQGLYSTHPNPRVGCVLVKDGQVVGEGWHVRAGEPHAEVHALRQAGENARGATAYVTLEPCSHFGRTPPCADALVGAGVARVVAAMQALESAFYQAGPALVATCAAASARERFQDAGHELLALPSAEGHVDLHKLLVELAARGANEVLVEAGPRLAGAFARLGLVDEYRLFVAPKFLGSSARPLLDWPLTRMADAAQLRIDDIRAVGDDWLVTARPHPRDA